MLWDFWEGMVASYYFACPLFGKEDGGAWQARDEDENAISVRPNYCLLIFLKVSSCSSDSAGSVFRR